MAQQEEASRVPVLIAPREQTVVDAARITFIWKPVRAARHYRLQIAKSSAFGDPVFESKELNRTEFTLRDELPPDEETYFWRVLVKHPDGAVHGQDNIESFVSGTFDDASQGIAHPNQDEHLGPVERLFRGAAAEAAAEVSGAPKWVREEDELGVEHEGIEAGQILGFIIAIMVAIGLSVFTLFQYVDLTAQAARVEAVSRSGYPELREVRLHAMQRLTQYDVVDPAQARYQIPIDRAMDLMVQETQSEPFSTQQGLLGLDQ